MHVSATIRTTQAAHEASVATDGITRDIPIPPREAQPGSSVNGGELLALALATCFGNDVYREAAAQGLRIGTVSVTAEGDFDAIGAPATAFRFRVEVTSPDDDAKIRALLEHTDRVAEIQNTVRQGVPVELSRITVNTSG